MSGVPHTPLLTPAQASRLLEEVIYERLAELVDFDAIYQLEQLLAYEIGELDELPLEEIPEVAKAMLDRAWCRLVDDPRRYVDLREGTGMDCESCVDEARQRGKPAAAG
jgi:hypothetical protein